MPVSASYRPEPAFAAFNEAQHGAFADPVEPADFPQRLLRFRNNDWAARIGLEALTDDEWTGAFARFEPLAQNQTAPLAIRYHGHQFRSYNPQIGDGRGFLFAQVRDDKGRLLDLATKGSGQTPYSRFGDGRLTLKGGVREVLAASMLEALGVYTSKAFALFETGESLLRGDEPSPTRSSVLTRLGHSHIRFGAFQRVGYLRDTPMLQPLVDHAVTHYYPELLAHEGKARVAAFFEAIVGASARLCASWMAAGFVHGVLNTDNMTVTGESFDYGPWRFLPTSDPGFTAAYFDETGLYAFGRQGEAVAWNLSRLGGVFGLVCDPEPLNAALQRFPELYNQHLRQKMLARLGLSATDNVESDAAFVDSLFGWMTQSQIGWAQFFHDWYAGRNARADALYDTPPFAPIRAGIEARASGVKPAHPYFARKAPVDMTIDEVERIWKPIADNDDWTAFNAKLADIAQLREALALTP